MDWVVQHRVVAGEGSPCRESWPGSHATHPQPGSRPMRKHSAGRGWHSTRHGIRVLCSDHIGRIPVPMMRLQVGKSWDLLTSLVCRYRHHARREPDQSPSEASHVAAPLGTLDTGPAVTATASACSYRIWIRPCHGRAISASAGSLAPSATWSRSAWAPIASARAGIQPHRLRPNYRDRRGGRGSPGECAPNQVVHWHHCS